MDWRPRTRVMANTVLLAQKYCMIYLQLSTTEVHCTKVITLQMSRVETVGIHAMMPLYQRQVQMMERKKSWPVMGLTCCFTSNDEIKLVSITAEV